MTIAACAEIVAAGDPDRFRATMSGPVSAREKLLPLYAFNLEVARAPWVSQEPMIAQMRLQFWRDTLAGIAGGGPVPAHEVAAPLAGVLRGAGLSPDTLDDIVVARWADVAREPFATEAALWDYLDATNGGLMWAGVAALGADKALEAPARALGRALGLANWLMAVAELRARGWAAWPSGDYTGLIARAGDDLATARAARFGAALPAARSAWRAPGVLNRARAHPDWIGTPRLAGAEAGARLRLIGVSLLRRW